MAFTESQGKAIGARANGFCGICGELTAAPTYHSATSEHLVRCKGGFKVTNAPQAFAVLEGRVLPPSANPFGPEAEDDGVALCYICHVEIHNIAWLETKLKNPNHKGKVVPPAILEKVTMDMIARGGNMVFYEDEVNLPPLDPGQ